MPKVYQTPSKETEEARKQGELIGIQNYRQTFIGSIECPSAHFPDARQQRHEQNLSKIQEAQSMAE